MIGIAQPDTKASPLRIQAVNCVFNTESAVDINASKSDCALTGTILFMFNVPTPINNAERSTSFVAPLPVFNAVTKTLPCAIYLPF
ncbi:hypothetical protein AKG98_3501 [Moritella sp. JT01]|nr:hypothetical protein AKG98_3501 [Moritella sp. JT01]